MKRPHLLGRVMRGAVIGFFALMTAFVAPAAAQGQGGGSPVFQNWFKVGNSAPLAVSTTTANVALPAGGMTARVCNTGAADAFVLLGTSNAVVVTSTTGTLIQTLKCQALNLVPFSTRYTYLAAITGASTSTLRIEVGMGAPMP